MFLFESATRCALTRRTPRMRISSVPVRTWRPLGAAAGAGALPAVRSLIADSRSWRWIRPSRPLPLTVERSMPASLARARVAGDAITRPPAGLAAGAEATLVLLAAGGDCAGAAEAAEAAAD